jgi:cold shock CspA family protein
MRTARLERRRGVVRAFDAHVGLGVVVDGGDEFVVHCTQIEGGARTVPAGTPVRFALAAGHRGRWEAVDVVADGDAFLCPVCGTAVRGAAGAGATCPGCGWLDSPGRRADIASGGLDAARCAWREAAGSSGPR